MSKESNLSLYPSHQRLLSLTVSLFLTLSLSHTHKHSSFLFVLGRQVGRQVPIKSKVVLIVVGRFDRCSQNDVKSVHRNWNRCLTVSNNEPKIFFTISKSLASSKRERSLIKLVVGEWQKVSDKMHLDFFN